MGRVGLRCGLLCLALALALALVSLPVQAHFLLNINIRVIHVQHLDDGNWRDYLRDGQPVTWSVRLEELEPGRYRVGHQ